jgi:hypothetical protein
MKKITTLCCAAVALSAQAQVAFVDTLSDKQLDEVVVDAQLQRANAKSTTYYPDNNVKRTAQSVADLLFQMAIPQIDVQPITGTVQTNSGEEVAIYIDMVPATKEEKDGLRAEDVKKVEYLVFPSDVRFHNDKFVINITLKHQEIGGYTKLTARDDVMIGSGAGLLYSRLNYKRMTYDLSVSDTYKDNRHTGTDQVQIFRFPQSDGSINEITRSNLYDRSHYKQNDFKSAFRARYNTENTSISNTISLYSQNTPRNDDSGRLLFSNALYKNGSYSNERTSSSVSPEWDGDYYFNLGKGFQLNTVTYFLYQRTKSNRLYTSDDTSIRTKAQEDALQGSLYVSLAKEITPHHSVNLFGTGAYNYNDVKYTGNTESSEIFDEMYYNAGLCYKFNTEKLSGTALAALTGESNKVNGTRLNNLYALGVVSLQYAISEKHLVSLFANRFVYTVEAVEKTPDAIQENELLYKKGSMYVNNTPGLRGKLEYTWLPSNAFSMSVYTGFERLYSRAVPVYDVMESGTSLLRTLENSGNYLDYNVGASFSAKFFHRKLVLKASPCYHYEKTTGVYQENNSRIAIDLSGTYYLGKFYFTGSYSLANKALLSYDMEQISRRSRNFYYLRAGWSNGKWNFSANAVNLFQKSWKGATTRLDNEWFSQYTTSYGSSYHRYVRLTVSYTFTYGKKVKHAEELDAESSAKSAIMH